MSAFLDQFNGRTHHESESIPMANVRLFGSLDSPCRIALVAGQHGDEPLGVDFAEQLGEAISIGEGIAMAVLPRANPDGVARSMRLNAHGIDLNRDHLELRAPETLAIHRLLHSFRPTLVVDLHQFKTRRDWMLQEKLEHGADVCLDWTTSPVAGSAVLEAAEQLGITVLREMSELSWRVDRYMVRSGNGTLRPSSPKLLSLLNYSAVRFGVPSILVEIREPTGRERRLAGEERARLVLRTIIERVCRLHRKQGPVHHDGVDRVAIEFRPQASPCGVGVWVRDLSSGEYERRTLATSYRPGWQATRQCHPPLAYGIPQTWVGVTDWLGQHGFRRGTRPMISGSVVRVARVKSVRHSRNRIGLVRRMDVDWRTDESKSMNWFVVSGTGHRLLPALLEPASGFGALKEGLLPWSPVVGADYPIVRLDASEKA